jgi:hypothetical protein
MGGFYHRLLLEENSLAILLPKHRGEHHSTFSRQEGGRVYILSPTAFSPCALFASEVWIPKGEILWRCSKGEIPEWSHKGKFLWRCSKREIPECSLKGKFLWRCSQGGDLRMVTQGGFFVEVFQGGDPRMVTQGGILVEVFQEGDFRMVTQMNIDCILALFPLHPC